jgi:hypothetical protein
MQKPIPQNAKGVNVTITAIDPNGNSQNIGTAQSDIGGNYAVAWTPPVEGIYHITATFAGTASYGNSYATTSMLIGPATPQAAPKQTATPTQPPVSTAPPTLTPTTAPTQTVAPTPSPVVVPPTSAAPTATYIAIGAIVIIIIAVAAALILRRRK